MAQLVGLIVSEDEPFRTKFGRWLRSGPVPVSIIDVHAPTEGTPPDVMIVDIRGDSSSAMASIERLRAAAPGAGIFVVALAADPDLILQAMRAGANEFLTWPPPEEMFQSAIRRTAARSLRFTRAPTHLSVQAWDRGLPTVWARKIKICLGL